MVRFTSRPSVIATVLLPVGVLCARSLRGQAIDVAAESESSQLCGPAKPGALVRVELHYRMVGARSHVGTLLRCSASELVLSSWASSEAPEFIAFRSTIRRVWTRRSAALEGALIGAASVGVFGGFLAAVKTSLCSTPTGPVNCHGNVPLGVIEGAAVGGVVGWLLGSGLPHWKRVYP